MKASALQNLIISQLVRRRGGTTRRWRTVVGAIRIYDPATHPHCNWAVSPSGEIRDVAQVEALLDQLRLDHPLVEAG